MKFGLFKLIILLQSFFVLVAAGGGFIKVSETNQKPSNVKIQSDEMKYFGQERRSIFSGNVVATSDNYTITSDTLLVTFNVKMDVNEIICDGGVNIKSNDIIATAKKAHVFVPKEMATLSGGVKVWHGDNFLEGDVVKIYYSENRIEVDKGVEKRVTIIFKPEENDKGN